MSLIQCHIDYACSFWYPGLSQLPRNKLQTTQNKIIRIVLKKGPRSHIVSAVFKSNGWSPVSKRVDQIILNHIYKVNSGIFPDYMKEQFVPTKSVHSYSTKIRENGSFSLPKVKSFGKKSFVYRRCILWNELPNNVKQIHSFQTFKTAVKSHFLDLN